GRRIFVVTFDPLAASLPKRCRNLFVSKRLSPSARERLQRIDVGCVALPLRSASLRPLGAFGPFLPLHSQQPRTGASLLSDPPTPFQNSERGFAPRSGLESLS